MLDRTTNRSNGYQSNLLELCVNPFVIADLSLAQGMSYRLQPFNYNEKLMDLREELKARMWQIIDAGVTERQKEVLKLYVMGFTQNEMAKQLGINQTSIHKILSGNINYKAKSSTYKEQSKKNRYGGVIKKVRKLCREDGIIQSILQEIAELCECMEL